MYGSLKLHCNNRVWGQDLFACYSSVQGFGRAGPFPPTESVRLLSFISWCWNFGVKKARQNQQCSDPGWKKNLKKPCLLQRYGNLWLSDLGLCCPRNWRLCGKGSAGKKLYLRVPFFHLGLEWAALKLGSKHRLCPGGRGRWSQGDGGEHLISQRYAPWARGISLFCSGMAHCAVGSLRVAALVGDGVARTAVVKTQRWLPLFSHWWEQTRTFRNVFGTWTTWAFSKLRTNSNFEVCVLKCTVPTSDISGISKVQCPFLIVIKVTCCLKAGCLHVECLRFPSVVPKYKLLAKLQHKLLAKGFSLGEKKMKTHVFEVNKRKPEWKIGLQFIIFHFSPLYFSL